MKTKKVTEILNSRQERLLLLLIFLFVFIDWLFLALSEPLGPPDVYKLFEVANRLFSGDFKTGIVPPLVPLILFPLGKVLELFMSPIEAFVLAGRLLSLAAGLGVTYFTYAFLRRFTGLSALAGTAFLVLSPWFLKLVSFPITDMLYLFFLSASFYLFIPPERETDSPADSQPRTGWGKAALAVAGALLTRFEGVLLIFSGLANYFKFKKKSFYSLLAGLGLLGLVLFFFAKFADRFFAHFRDIILARQSYLFIFQHPMDFLNVIYGNILFFIPFSFPYLLKLLLLVSILLLFGYGVYRMFKMQRHLTLALLVYEILYLVAKGYIDTTRPGIEFRRIFSGLWIFYLFCFVGGYFFIKKMEKWPLARRVVLLSSMLLMGVLAFSLPLPSLSLLALPLPLLPVILVPVLRLRKNASQNSDLKENPALRVAGIVAWLLLILFTAQITYFSFRKSHEYVGSMASKAPYAAAQWLNMARLKSDAVILAYTNKLMMNCYLDHEKIKEKNITWENVLVPLVIAPDTREHYIKAFFKEIRERDIDYIIFDNYVVPKPEFNYENQAKRMLFEERENKNLFRVKKYLFYNGENVGYVLKPVLNAQTDN